MRLLFIILLLPLSACQLLPSKKNAELDAQINPGNQQESVVEISALMNDAVKSLYSQAKQNYQNNLFDAAIVNLEKAFEIQPTVTQITQLMAEIYLHQGKFEHAYHWAIKATKNGPAKGSACTKSWRILAIAAGKMGDFSQQSVAIKQSKHCLVQPPNRY